MDNPSPFEPKTPFQSAVLGQTGFTAAALFFLWMSVFLIAAVFGFIEMEDEPDPWARWLVILPFGIVIALVGLFMLGQVALAASPFPGDRPVPRGKLLAWCISRLPRRVSGRGFYTAVTTGVTAVEFGMRLFHDAPPFFIASEDTLAVLILLLALSIHGFPFFVLAVGYATGTPHPNPRMQYVPAGFLLLVYLLFAWDAGGVVGLLTFGWLMLPVLFTYAGHLNEDWQKTRLGMRWVVQFMLFFSCVMLAGAEDLQAGGDRVLLAGLLYFTLMTFLELFDAAEIPVDAAISTAKRGRSVYLTGS